MLSAEEAKKIAAISTLEQYVEDRIGRAARDGVTALRVAVSHANGEEVLKVANKLTEFGYVVSTDLTDLFISWE